jgi:hypothetical protein
MNSRIVFLVFVVLGWPGTAFAGCGNLPSTLSQAQLDTLLTGRYACGRSTATNPPGWNELHIGGGSLQEQHEGGSTVETVGTWATSTFGSGGQARGRVTYTYPSGSYVYEVALPAAGSCAPNCTTVPQTFVFCGQSSGAPASLSIYVSTSFQAPSSPGVMNANCPSNP